MLFPTMLSLPGPNFQKTLQRYKNVILSHFDPKTSLFMPRGLVAATAFSQTKDPSSIPVTHNPFASFIAIVPLLDCALKHLGGPL